MTNAKKVAKMGECSEGAMLKARSYIWQIFGEDDPVDVCPSMYILEGLNTWWIWRRNKKVTCE